MQLTSFLVSIDIHSQLGISLVPSQELVMQIGHVSGFQSKNRDNCIDFQVRLNNF